MQANDETDEWIRPATLEKDPQSLPSSSRQGRNTFFHQTLLDLFYPGAQWQPSNLQKGDKSGAVTVNSEGLFWV